MPNLHSLRCSFFARLEDSDTRDLTMFTLATAVADDYLKLGVTAKSKGLLRRVLVGGRRGELSGRHRDAAEGRLGAVSIEIHGGTKPTATVSVNGIIDQQALTVPDFASGYTSIELTVQPSDTNGPGKWGVSFDDLVCDAL